MLPEGEIEVPSTSQHGAPASSLALRLGEERGVFREPPFGQVSVEDRDLVDIARERIAGLFGRRSDGTYTMTMANTTGDPQEFRTEVEAMARVRGCSVAEVLSMTRLQVMEEMLTSIVRTEALELKAYALRTGHLEVLETMGDLLDEADLRGRETKQ